MYNKTKLDADMENTMFLQTYVNIYFLMYFENCVDFLNNAKIMMLLFRNRTCNVLILTFEIKKLAT